MTTVMTQTPSPSTNANEAATSTPKVIDIASLVNVEAERATKGVTRQRFMLNREKLVNAVRAKWKSLVGESRRDEQGNVLPALARVPSEIDDTINTCVDNFINATLRSNLHAANLQSVTRSFAHDARNLMVVESVTAKGRNILAMNEQKLGITLLIGAQEKRLTALQAKKTPNHEAELNCNKAIAKLKLTHAHIMATIATVQAATE